MLLIATDEAGYGPKLGPLVVAATLWELPVADPVDTELAESFSQIAQPMVVDGVRYVVDDSKAVYQPASSGKKSSMGYSKLERVTAAGCLWSGVAEGRLSPLVDLAAEDRDQVAAAPWLAQFASAGVDTKPGKELVEHWSTGSARLLRISSRVITAASFNHMCECGMNKSDLLSQVTLGLVKSLLLSIDRPTDETVEVYCDRHGGRRYYASVLQSVFDGSLVQVASESKQESRYRVPFLDHDFTIRFTVKGDSFTPVAFSSIVAKYLREKAMESLNRYFLDRHHGSEPLLPTAGYPVDADRFLADVEETLIAEAIERSSLVRTR